MGEALARRGLRRPCTPPARWSSCRPRFLGAPARPRASEEDPCALDFGLQISRFDWPGHPRRPARRSPAVARAAEEAGFTSLWVMDHFLQIPQVGREWEDMLESYTTLAYLAGVTERIRLGTLVTGITYRNVAHLAKIVATLDVLSGGRARVRARRGLVRARAPALRLGRSRRCASATPGSRTRSSCCR